MIQIVVCYNFRGGSRTAATSKVELFVIIINDLQPLTIITKSSTLDVAAVLNPSLFWPTLSRNSPSFSPQICFLQSSIEILQRHIITQILHIILIIFRSSPPEVFLGKCVLEISIKYTGEHQCQSAISKKLLCNFIKITLRHGCHLYI